MNSRELFTGIFEGKEIERPPVWFMRQAGRYLPEYRKLREGKTFEQMASTPDLAKEITLQPIRRFDLDAAIIFSDILIPLYSMERGLSIKPQIGPVLDRPLTDPLEVESLHIPRPELDFPYVVESIEMVREEIPDKWFIGFAGAPFTLASYLIEGQSTRNALLTRKFAFEHEESFRTLLDLLAEIVLRQLRSQIDAGVNMVQIFDSWAGFLSADQYREWVLPSLKKVIEKLDVPTMIYARGSSHLLEILSESGADGISIDGTLSLSKARGIVGAGKVLQGNLDPALLQTNTERVKREVMELLKQVDNQRYIFNLAQGIDKSSSVACVASMVESVKSWRYVN